MSADPFADRVRRLNDAPLRPGRYVLYWMQQSQRATFNHALEHAIRRANELGQPLLVGFGVMDDYPEANVRHYRFMLEGLRETRRALASRGAPLVVRRGNPADVAAALAKEAAWVVCDRGYLRHQRRWRLDVAERAACPVEEVESDVVVPVEVASDHREFAARTLRPRLQTRWSRYLVHLPEIRLEHTLRRAPGSDIDLEDLDDALASLRLDRSVPPVTHRFRGGPGEARARLHSFVRERLRQYQDDRRRPEADTPSHLSPYLHFGQISPLEVAVAAKEVRGPGRDSFLEELLVRRELAYNFVAFTEDYDRWSAIPDWAVATLRAQESDPRPVTYDRRALDGARTHDAYWNAAMREMKYTGYTHNMLRMYWGKKILEWTADPEDAFQVTLALNNRYLLDGRDCSSYANVAWVFGLHDRPFGKRPIYGKVRSMTAAGLERKTDIAAYVARVDAQVAEARRAGVTFPGEA